jgi:hypothetical protein
MKVLVAIKSCWKYKERRDAQRATWLPELVNLATDHLFVVGRHGWTRPTREKPYVSQTNNLHGEEHMHIIDADDDFPHIAPKVKAICQHAIATEYDLLVVLDDDTYVVPSRLMELCRQHYDNRFDITAYFRTDPQYPQGSAYILSQRAMSILAASKTMLERGPDDVLAGRVLLKHSLQVFHTNQLAPGPTRLVTPLKNNGVVSTHKCLPHEMIAAHKDWINSNG